MIPAKTVLTEEHLGLAQALVVAAVGGFVPMLDTDDLNSSAAHGKIESRRCLVLLYFSFEFELFARATFRCDKKLNAGPSMVLCEKLDMIE